MVTSNNAMALLALLAVLTMTNAYLDTVKIDHTVEELLELLMEHRSSKDGHHPSNAGHKHEASKLEQKAERWFEETDESLRVWSRQSALASFNYMTNLTDENAQTSSKVTNDMSAWMRSVIQDARKWLKIAQDDWDPLLIRKLNQLVNANEVPVPESSQTQQTITSLMNKLEGLYGNAVVVKDGKNYRIEPEFTEIMTLSRDWDELQWAWKAWRDATGPKMKDSFTELVQALNTAATDNGMSDLGEAWRVANYEQDEELIRMVDQLYEDIRPLYEQLHAYVRARLIETYPDRGIDPNGTIPAHILGNMWAQQWTPILDLVLPYPHSASYDVTDQMVKQGYTPRSMFELSQAFFYSLGMDNMTETFWNKSMMVRPSDGTPVQCHASAEDFSSKDCTDFRIKMCTEVNMDYLQTIHHEMGHIQYFMQYCPQPIIFHAGANAAFHEAIGDTMALSVMTPQHLKAIGLLKTQDRAADREEEKKKDLNFLMKAALEKVAFLPFGYLIDKWRWEVFSGHITPEQYNTKWWEYRTKYQGVVAPVERTENDFDPGAKYHVPSFVPYIRYFLSFIGQFQFHQALCSAAGHTGPLHTCDIYKSRQAGDHLMSVLRLGSRAPWQDTMELMTGQRQFKADAIKEYFQPLTDWLQEQNAETTKGWS